jgi:hypothetical protein
VEHRIARLAQLGIRKSRFFGRQKTKFQLLMASAVANLTLVWGGSVPADDGALAGGQEDPSDAGLGLSSSLLRALSGSLRALRGFLSASRGLAPRCRPVAAAGC